MKKVALHNLGCKIKRIRDRSHAGNAGGRGKYEIVAIQEGADIYHQYLHRDKYRRPQIKTNAAPRPEDESGGAVVVGNELLCAGAGSKRECRSMYRLVIRSNQETRSAVCYDPE